METKSAIHKLGEKQSPNPTGKSADLGDFRIEKTGQDATEGYTTFTKIDHEAEEKQKEDDRKEMEEEAKKEDAKSTLVSVLICVLHPLSADSPCHFIAEQGTARSSGQARSQPVWRQLRRIHEQFAVPSLYIHSSMSIMNLQLELSDRERQRRARRSAPAFRRACILTTSNQS